MTEFFPFKTFCLGFGQWSDLTIVEFILPLAKAASLGDFPLPFLTPISAPFSISRRIVSSLPVEWSDSNSLHEILYPIQTIKNSWRFPPNGNLWSNAEFWHVFWREKFMRDNIRNLASVRKTISIRGSGKLILKKSRTKIPHFRNRLIILQSGLTRMSLCIQLIRYSGFHIYHSKRPKIMLSVS